MLQDLYRQLSHQYDSYEAKAIVRIVFEQEFGISYTELLCNGDNCLTQAQYHRLTHILNRLNSGEPVQYILGKAEFFGRMFKVTPATLIPRPETEILINALHSPLSTLRSPRILDIGTGSGCIGITIALEHPDCHVEAWDISSEALKVAQDNATSLSAHNINFRQVDILNSHLTFNISQFSLIVSNPPYICQRERITMDSRVLDFEPSQALFVPDNDPLLFYRAISGFALKYLQKGGSLFFEINQAFGNEVVSLLADFGFTNINIQKDQYGNDRIVSGSL